MTDWISTGVVTIVVIVGLAIFYKALKEPIDIMLHWILRGLIWVKDSLVSLFSSGEKVREVITYG